MMAYWNIEKYWLQNKTISHKLTELKDEIENEDKAGDLKQDKIQGKFTKYATIKSEFYKYREGALGERNNSSNQ